MALRAVAGTTDLTGLGKGKRIASWQLSNTGAAAVINFRDGSAAATRYIQVQLAANSSASQSYFAPAGCPLFPNGLFIEIVSGVILGSVDLV